MFWWFASIDEDYFPMNQNYTIHKKTCSCKWLSILSCYSWIYSKVPMIFWICCASSTYCVTWLNADKMYVNFEFMKETRCFPVFLCFMGAWPFIISLICVCLNQKISSTNIIKNIFNIKLGCIKVVIEGILLKMFWNDFLVWKLLYFD